MPSNEPSIAPSLALALLEQAPAAIIATTPAGDILFANHSARMLFGHAHRHLIGHPFDHVLAAPSRPVRAALWEQCHAGRRPHANIRLQGLHEDGREIGLWLSLRHVHADGQSVLLASLQSDDAQGEDPAVRPPVSMESLVHLLPVGMYVSEAVGDYGAIFVSEGFRDQVDHAPADLVGNPAFWFERIHPDDRAHVRAGFEQGLAIGHMSYEYRVRDGSGAYRWVQDIVNVVRDADGAPRWIVGCIVEIGQRKAAEQALTAAEARNRALLQAIPDMIFVNRRDGVVVDYKAAPSQLVIPVDQLIGRNLRDIIHLPPEIIDLYLTTFARVLDSGEAAVVEYAMDIEGARHYREARVTVCGPDEVLVIVRDITARTVTEQRIRDLNQRLEQQNRELERFSYSVSHDLRAPLRAIDGFSYLIENRHGGALDDQGRGLLQRIRASARHMSQLIDDLLALARITRSAVHRERVDLSALAAEALDDLRAAAPDRRVEVAITPRVPATGDRRLLRILLDNLLGNAWKYTSARDDARIALGMEEHAGERVYFVRDNGVGFDMRYADKLFHPFQRLHASHEFPGTGIGLATVARIVDQHGGRIWADAAVGQGATFYFTLAGDARRQG